jgi:hypothetical protein
LFVGNSLTQRNGLVTMVHRMAAVDTGARPIFAVQWVLGGSTLRRASRNHSLTRLLDEIDWDLVVLQEQSRRLSLSPERRRAETLPAALTLHERIAGRGARTVLFQTWGYKHGDRRGEPFEAMEARLEDGYAELAAELGAAVAPVGRAWAVAAQHYPEIDLWSWDGVHPRRAGSYLAACVLYSVLSGREPPARFTGGLDERDAANLRYVASRVVPRNVAGRATSTAG